MAKSGPSKTAPRATDATGWPRSRRLARRNSARRTIRLLVICVVAAALVLAVPIYLFYQDYQARNADHRRIGVTAAAAGCDPVAEEAGHRQPGARRGRHQGPLHEYPPDSGTHYAEPAPFTKHFYAEADRPAVGTLVHNLEHGYTVVWYRATRAGGSDRCAGADLEDLQQRRLRPDQEVHRGAVDRFRRGRLPRRQERGADALDGRSGRPGQPRHAEGRPPGLRGGQRSGDQGLHGQVPDGELARAQRGLSA